MSIASLHTHRGIRGNVSSEKLKIFCIFETEIVHYSYVSANLDQTMCKKKIKKK